MADIVTRFKLENTQFESKLRDSAQGLKDLTRELSATGKDFDKFSAKSVEQAKALGDISTSATNTKGKVRELVGAFNSVANAYNALTDQQKSSDYGQAMSDSLQKLRERLSEAKQEMQQMQTQSGSSGNVLEELAGKVGLSVTSFTALGAAGAAATAALKIVKDAFFESETNVDEWGRTVASAESTYKLFLNSLNNGDFSGFLSGISRVVQAAKDAYNAIDELNTRMTIINPERAKLQAKQQEYQAKIRMYGKDSKEGRAAQASLKALEPKLAKSYQKESEMNKDAFVQRMILRAAEGGETLTKAEAGALLATFSDDKKYQNFRRNATGKKGTRVINNTYGVGGQVLQNYDTRNKNARLMDIFTDKWRQENQGFLTASFNAQGQAWSLRKQDARYLKEDSPKTQSTGTPSHTPNADNTIEVPEGSMKALNEEYRKLTEAQQLVTRPELWQQYQAQLDGVTARMKALRGETEEVAKIEGRLEEADINPLSQEGLAAWKAVQESIIKDADYGSSIRTNAIANAADTQTFSNLLAFADANSITIPDELKETLGSKLLEGINIEDEDFQPLLDVINEHLQSMGLEPIKIDFDTSSIKTVTTEVKKATDGWKKAASAVSQVGSALQQIDDPAVKIIGIVGEAIASVALAMAQATSKEASGGVWAWIAAVAAGTATMISTIASIKSATAGSYAEGGIIPGNSPTGDLLTANVNSGELILNRAQQDSVAAQLNDGGARPIVLDTRLRGEDLYLVQRTFTRRKGWGQYIMKNKE